MAKAVIRGNMSSYLFCKRREKLQQLETLEEVKRINQNPLETERIN